MTDYPTPSKPMDTADHPDVQRIPPSDYWAGKPASERPFMGVQKSNIPDANPHTQDPWNKAFKD